MCGEKTLPMQEANTSDTSDTGSAAESPAFCRSFLILCLVCLSCQVDGQPAGEFQCFPWNPEISSGRRSHDKGPPLPERCLPSLIIIHTQWDRHEWSPRSSLDRCFWTCNAAQHVFCSTIPKRKIMLLVERSERSARLCKSVLFWLNLKAPTTAQWTAVTLLLSYARPLQRLSVWCQAQCCLLGAFSLCPLANTETYSWTSQALVPEFVILIQVTLILFAVALVWTFEPEITCTCIICNVHWFGISKYLFPLSQIVLTRSILSHSPEDAVILIVLRRMSLSTLVFSWT